MPLLVGIANIVGLFSGMVSAQLSLGLSFETFLFGARLFWLSWDLFYSPPQVDRLRLRDSRHRHSHGTAHPRAAAEGVGSTTTASVMFQTLTIFNP